MHNLNGFEIAIIGMACRFPDADTVDEFWENIYAGKDSIRPLSPEELFSLDIDDSLFDDPDLINSGSFLEGIDQFDPGLFGYSAAEADCMDPQHRLFLHVVWEALENAGIATDQETRDIGLYAGASSSSYLIEALKQNPEMDSSTLQNLCYENNHDLIATRVAYKLNLTGPAVTIGSACSTSLVLVHSACQALIAGECDIAIAGAARVSVPQKCGYQYAQGGILSRDGKCRTFDAGATGTISGSGVAAIVLKPLQSALDDRDPVCGIIKGSAINNDGARKIGFTAPSVPGQVDVVERALHAAQVNPESIGYIEAHGTGTALGDPIEIRALTEAYRRFTDKTDYCAIGSVKANIGHLDTCAGLAGIIKTCGVLKKRQLPPSINFETPNPEIDFTTSPFFVTDKTAAWPLETSPRAAVSAFGIGGTNAHVIMEFCPQDIRAERPTDVSGKSVLTFSGNTREALRQNIENVKNWLQRSHEANIADMAFTLNCGRNSLKYRRSLVVAHFDDAISQLQKLTSQELRASRCDDNRRPLVMMFSGQGSQYHTMGAGLYRDFPEYKNTVDECSRILLPLLNNVDIREVIFHDGEHDSLLDSRLYHTRYTQPALFVTEYALAMTLVARGLVPAALIGHSIGEYVAACVAGVFSLPDALKLVSARAEAMANMPQGAMISVTASADAVTPYLSQDVALAAVNGPALCVLSGADKALGEVEKRLQQRGFTCRKLHTSHAFHSSMMEPCIPQFEKAFSQIVFQTPRYPIVSTMTGTWVDDQHMGTKHYWLEQLRAPVQFQPAIEELQRAAHYVYLEIGPGRVLASLAAMEVDDAIATMREVKTPVSDQQALLQAIGGVWQVGGEINWKAYHGGKARQKLTLPTYAFQKQTHWFQERRGKRQHVTHPTKKQALDNWFYRPVWKQMELPERQWAKQDANILMIVEKKTPIASLTHAFKVAGFHLVTVYAGKKYRCLKKGERYGLDISVFHHWESLFSALNDYGIKPTHIVHLLNISDKKRRSREMLDVVFYSLLYLARGFSKHFTHAVSLTIAGNRMYYSGGGKLNPEKSLAVGPCKVLPREYQNFHCRCIDIDNLKFFRDETLIGKFISDIHVNDNRRDSIIAYREGARYVQYYESVALSESEHADSPFREGGSYLITGGFGGIGATIARHLCGRYSATVILTTRDALPEPSEWENWCANPPPGDTTVEKINAIKTLQSLGGRVSVVTTDLSDPKDLVLRMKLQGHTASAIDGIFHCAGAADGGLIEVRDRQTSEYVLAPKLTGTETLLKAFDHVVLDFIALCSSLSAYIGPMGQVAYCAGNTFLNATAHAYPGKKIVSIGWDAWQQVGMAVDTLLAENVRQSGEQSSAETLKAIQHGITPEEGMEVLERVLQFDYPEILTSTRPLEALNTLDIEAEPATSDDEVDLHYHPRPELSTTYRPAIDELDVALVGIWQKRFGIAPIGIDDDFFELHGHSLLAVQIATEIKQHFAATLPAGALYENPTVGKLAALIRTIRLAAIDDPELDENEKLITYEL